MRPALLLRKPFPPYPTLPHGTPCVHMCAPLPKCAFLLPSPSNTSSALPP